MGMRRRTRRRALVAGAAISHHRSTKNAEAQQALPSPRKRRRPRNRRNTRPLRSDPAAEIEHLSQLHDSGAITDEEFAAAKAKVLGA